MTLPSADGSPADSTPAENPSLGVVMVAGAAVAWSTAGFFTHLIDIGTFATVVWRNVFGGLFLTGWLVATQRRRAWHAVASLKKAGWIAALCNGLSMICYLGALRHTSVTNVVVIYATAPFVAAAMAYGLSRERPSRRVLLAGGVALIGVCVTMTGSTGRAGRLGDLLAVGMTVGLALFTVVARQHPERSMTAASCLSAWIGALIALPFAGTLAVTPVESVQLALFGVVSFGLGLILYSTGARHIPAARSSLIAALDTPLAPLWVWLGFGLRPAPASVIGGLMVIAAVVWNILADRPPTQAGAAPAARTPPGMAE
ncbi:MAG: EamA family transporter [Nocardioides sp.]|uniref:DMT family transporter n=1 Tax=Nocardioides sp. TaxID=35761 RepID=UPI0039E3E78A